MKSTYCRSCNDNSREIVIMKCKCAYTGFLFSHFRPDQYGKGCLEIPVFFWICHRVSDGRNVPPVLKNPNNPKILHRKEKPGIAVFLTELLYCCFHSGSGQLLKMCLRAAARSRCCSILARKLCKLHHKHFCESG